MSDEEKLLTAQRFARQFKRAKRSIRGLSYRKLAELVDVEYTAPAKWAAACWIPKGPNIERLAEIFQVRPEWFFSDDEHPNEREALKHRRKRIRLFGRPKE